MAQKSKAYRAAAEKIEAGKFYTPARPSRSPARPVREQVRLDR